MIRWELPEGWEWTTVGEVIDEGPSNGYSGPVGVDGTPTLRLSATTKGRLILNQDTTKRLEETMPAGSSFFLRDGDLLVQRSNSLDYIGAAAIYDGPEHTYIYPDLMMRIRVGTKVDRSYLWQWLNSAIVRRSMRERATGTAGGMPKINGKTLVSTAVPLPPPDEQTRIVTRLNALQARITTARAGLDELRQLATALKRAVLDAAFRGELTAAWREAHPDTEPASVLLDRLRAERRRRWQEAHPKKPYLAPEPVDPTDLPDLPEGWCWASLDEILSEPLANGRSVPTQDDGFPVLRLTALRGGDIDLGERKGGAWTLNEARPFLVKPGDYLLSRGNGSLHLVGRGGLVPSVVEPVAFPDTMIRVRVCEDHVLPEFFSVAWGSPGLRRQIEERSKTTAGIHKVSQADLSGIAVPIPPMDEQRALVPQVRAATAAAQRALDAARALTDDLTTTEHALLTAAFRGELVPPAIG